MECRSPFLFNICPQQSPPFSGVRGPRQLCATVQGSLCVPEQNLRGSLQPLLHVHGLIHLVADSAKNPFMFPFTYPPNHHSHSPRYYFLTGRIKLVQKHVNMVGIVVCLCAARHLVPSTPLQFAALSPFV